ncbi:MAG TPA: DNA-directed RNA polymerase subunit A', partial [Thermoplasmata archaeon]|nr:DNA-directed RNA polymerase subunit A' [Thermoplasmata archaeon]
VNYVVRDDGRRLRVTDTNVQAVAESLTPGFIVERQLKDGDIVLFNRQPSLHRMSMMAHRVRVMKHKTFRFNLCVCPPYNADFDGDEMNLHVPQSEEARAEARILMAVQEHILSPRFGGPVIGMIHDHITGLFMLTNGDKRFDRKTTMFLVHRLSLRDFPPPEGKDKDVGEYWTGKQLFSLLIPKNLSMEFKASIMGRLDPKDPEADEVDGYVRIVDGVLKTGTIDGNGVSAFKGKLLDRVTRDYGPEYAKRFLDQSTKLGLAMIMLKGFSTGLDDEDIPEEAKRQIEKELKQGSDEVDGFVRQFDTGKLEQLPGRSLEETLEVEVMKVLGRARDKAGQIASKHLGIENSAVIMARSGARGSMLNLSQMAGCIGQQAVRGERLSRGYRDRTLPHFTTGDKGAEAKGFVKSCYKSGLTPTEYFFHSMGGREGLVDTAVRTSRSGYMQRRLINALEDLKVTADRSVRNTAGTVIQFRYGEDGIDPCRSEQGESVNMNTVLHAALGKKYDEVGEELEKMIAYGELEHETPEVEPEGEAPEPEEE